MKTFVISYDLQVPDKKYDKVFKTIESWGGYSIRPLKSVFLVKNNLTAQEMADSLKKFALDSNDLLFITEVGKDKAGWLYDESWKFINEHLY